MASAKPTTDPYRILGVLRGADLAQIKAAHRRLAKRYHPDGATGDEERFLAVQEAYLLLSDPSRRREWDRRHAPGPVRAEGTTRRRRPRGSGRPASRPPRRGRASGARTKTWSAERVPWWQDFRPRSSRREGSPKPSGADPTTGDRDAATTPLESDPDVFSRSSGAAWSAAARRHFRRGDDDLPSRGVWRYRGTQVVTGAEARRVAAEEEEERTPR
jgi:curved DNA-binding protein CbpA